MESDIEFVKMSDKGQLVVPQEIRESANLNPGQKFVAFPLSDGVLFKKVEMPKVKLDFEALAKDVETQFKKNQVKKSDVTEAVKWSRKK
jgi:bifunctional DNA-binding transcriptional regulator/antitoxin component of YhaV-PrlF toxin-antitoxin module